MQTELKAASLNIDIPAARQKLKDAGAWLVHELRLLRRYNFDFPDDHLQKAGGWVRFRRKTP